MTSNWTTEPLIEVCTEITDGSHFSPESSAINDFPYITVRDIDEKGQIDFNNCKFISKKDYANLLSNGCKPNRNDLLFSKDGTVGKVSLVDFEKEFVVLSSLAIIRPNKLKIDSNYLKYVLLSPVFLNTAIDNKTGVAIRRIILKNLKQIEIAYPKSLKEQKQIVAILDEAFAAIDKAKANIEKNIENAKELFESYLSKTFKSIDKSNFKKLGDYCDLIGGGTPSKSNLKYYGGNILWATVRDMNVNIIESTENSLTEIGLKNSSSNIVPAGNVIIATRVGLGKVCLLLHDTAINQDLKGLVPKSKFDISSKYIFWWYKSVAKEVIEAGTGATVQGVKLPFIKELSFPILNRMDQNELVAELDEVFRLSQNMMQNYEKKLNSLNEFKKSILQKAFAGELSEKLLTV